MSSHALALTIDPDDYTLSMMVVIVVVDNVVLMVPPRDHHHHVISKPVNVDLNILIQGISTIVKLQVPLPVAHIGTCNVRYNTASSLTSLESSGFVKEVLAEECTHVQM